MKIIYLTLFFTLIAVTVDAQIELRKQGVDAGGAIVQGGNVDMLFTVGEVADSENESGSVILSEGFIGKDSNLATRLREFSQLIGVNVFPNPTSDKIHISIPDDDTYQYELMDISGKVLILSGKLEQRETVVDINDLESSTYLLLVTKTETKKASVHKVIVQ